MSMYGIVKGVNVGDMIEVTQGIGTGLIGIVKEICKVESGWSPLEGQIYRYYYTCVPKLVFGVYSPNDVQIFQTYEGCFKTVRPT